METPAYDAIVVGAGLAGLIAARDLAEAGCRVLLLEARERDGGRVWYAAPPGLDHPVELGGGWFDAEAQPPLREEAARYGIPIARATEYETTRWFTGGELRQGLPVPLLGGGDLEQLLVALTDAAREVESGGAGAVARYDVPITEWLDGLRPEPATRDFALGWFTLMTGADPATTSALGSIGHVLGKGNAYSFYTDLAHVLPTGTTSLVKAVAADLRGEHRRGCPVRSVLQTDGVVTVEAADGMRFAAELVVLAVPVAVLPTLELDPPLAADLRTVIADGHPCRMTKLWLLATGVPRRMLGAGWNTPFYWLAAEREVEDAQLVVAFALEGALDPDDPGAAERALRAYAPDARVHAVGHHDWVADPFSRGGWFAQRPGWATLGLRARLAEPHGRVLLAGSDVAPEHAGWFAGAIASGRHVARQALERLGVLA